MVCQLETTWVAKVGPNTTTYNDQNTNSKTCGDGVVAYNSTKNSTYAIDQNVSQ